MQETRLFRGSIVKRKHQGLTSLTFMQLVPGADRVVAKFAFGVYTETIILIHLSVDRYPPL